MHDCIAHATEIPENTKIMHAELMITHAFWLAFWRKQVLLKCVDEVDCRADMVVRMCNGTGRTVEFARVRIIGANNKCW